MNEEEERKKAHKRVPCVHAYEFAKVKCARGVSP